MERYASTNARVQNPTLFGQHLTGSVFTLNKEFQKYFENHFRLKKIAPLDNNVFYVSCEDGHAYRFDLRKGAFFL